MKPGYICFFLLCQVQCTSSKAEMFFSGEVTYSYSYDSNILNTDSITNLKPSKSIFKFDLTNYQSCFTGKDTFTFNYSGLLNKAISETNSQKDYDCEDYSIATDSISSFKVYDTDEEVLGYKCSIIEFQSKNLWNRYYVSKELKIAPATYQKHKAYNWSFYGEKTAGGLILKLEHRFKHYTIRGIATDNGQAEDDFQALNITESAISKICAAKK